MEGDREAEEDRALEVYCPRKSGENSPSEETPCGGSIDMVLRDAYCVSRMSWAPISPPHCRRATVLAVSIVPASLLVVLGLTMVLSVAFDAIDGHYVEALFLFVYCLAFMSMASLFLLHKFDLLVLGVLKAGDRKQGFIRAGVFVLASGGIIYQAFNMYETALIYRACNNPVAFATEVMAVIVTTMQVLFLAKFQMVEINKSVLVAVWGRLVLLHLTTTNIMLWFATITRESQRDIAAATYIQPATTYTQSENASTMDVLHGNDTEENKLTASYQCGFRAPIGDVVVPYTYPLLIEFCILATSVHLSIWERCCPAAVKNHLSKAGKLDLESSELDLPSIKYHNTNEGFFCGWIVLILTLIFVFISLYDAYTNKAYNSSYGLAVYGFNMALSSLVLVACLFTFFRMRVMRSHDDRKTSTRERRDRGLMSVTYFMMVFYKMFCIIAGLKQAQYSLVYDGIVSIISGLVQCILLGWYAANKRLAHPKQKAFKPGRQGLEFLRCVNLCLWIINTFVLKTTSAKQPLENTYGNLVWAIMSNIVHPMTILYYFHSMISISEIIAHAHTWVRPLPGTSHDEESTPAGHPYAPCTSEKNSGYDVTVTAF